MKAIFFAVAALLSVVVASPSSLTLLGTKYAKIEPGAMEHGDLMRFLSFPLHPTEGLNFGPGQQCLQT